MDVPRVRSWRSAFLTLRDEAATSTSIPSVLSLIRNLASQSEIIVPAASNLPPREVLDEFLRAASGFKGMDDHLDDKLFDTFAEFPRRSKVSSAPFFQHTNVVEVSKENHSLDSAGSSQWNEAIEKYLPPMLLHTNALRFRRACFSVEANTHDELVSVRITTSWALANICDALRCKAGTAEIGHCLTGPNSGLLALLAYCALQLAHDNDKVKENMVRALGNLSRFLDLKGVNYSNLESCSPGHISLLEAKGNPIPRSIDSSYWLEKVVQTFVSCVTTGNVKVQWNVCHALANLFQNETLVLHAMPW